METIPQELLDFETIISPQLSNMNSTLSKLSSKLSELTDSVTTFKNGLDSYYESSNKSSIINSVSSISSLYSTINTSASATIKSILDSSEEIINKIKGMQKKNIEIQALQDEISEEENKDNPSQSIIDSAKSSISILINDFNILKDDAIDTLNKLKSTDPTLEIESSNNSVELPTVAGGSFVKREFTSSKNVKVSYYIYIPDLNDTTNLGINMYLHGTGEMGNVLKRGLPLQLANKEITPSGIVICPETRKEQLYYDSNYREALIELTKSVAEEYQADTKRISLSGHSSGAILSYNLVKMAPNYFSAIVPLSGGEYLTSKDTSAFNDVSVWAFHGDKDPHTQRANYSNVINRTLKPLEESGVDTYLTTLKGKNHDIQNLVFNKKFTDKDGETINPLEWALKQSRA